MRDGVLNAPVFYSLLCVGLLSTTTPSLSPLCMQYTYHLLSLRARVHYSVQPLGKCGGLLSSARYREIRASRSGHLRRLPMRPTSNPCNAAVGPCLSSAALAKLRTRWIRRSTRREQSRSLLSALDRVRLNARRSGAGVASFVLICLTCIVCTLQCCNVYSLSATG